MSIDLSAEFEKLAPKDRHYAYGVNCYQHAIGYPHPLLVFYGSTRDDGAYEGVYINLNPGNFDSREYAIFHEEADLLDYRDFIIQQCLKDGFVEFGPALKKQDGHRTIAIFFSDNPRDFHFAYLNKDGLCIHNTWHL